MDRTGTYYNGYEENGGSSDPPDPLRSFNMSYDPKWIRDDAVVKRDGTNDLTGDWDVGISQRIISIEELQNK
jgi:hypothetical protein